MPAKATVHPIFQVFLLKKYVGGPSQDNLELPSIIDEGVVKVEPKKILDTRWIKQGKKFVEERLVK